MRGAARLVASLPIAIMASALQVACAPADDRSTPKDGGGDAGGDAAGGGPDGADGADAASEGGDGSGASPPTYTKDAQPIFKAKCGPCHDGQGLGNHNIAETYDDVKKLMPDTAFDAPMECWKDTERTMPKTIGECAVIAAKLGWMPFQKGCGGAMPADPAACVSSSEIAILETWVAAGMPE